MNLTYGMRTAVMIGMSFMSALAFLLFVFGTAWGPGGEADRPVPYVAVLLGFASCSIGSWLLPSRWYLSVIVFVLPIIGVSGPVLNDGTVMSKLLSGPVIALAFAAALSGGVMSYLLKRRPRANRSMKAANPAPGGQ